MFTLWAFIKHSLALINTSKLNRVETHFWSAAFDARFFDSYSDWLVGGFERCLLFVTLRPKGHHRVR